MLPRPRCLIVLLIGSLLLNPVYGQDVMPAKVIIAGIEGHLILASSWLKVDPLTDPHLIPARAQDSSWSGGEVQRFVRIYFPRTYERLIEFEYMILASIEVWVFSNKQQQMLHDSILNDGLGGMQERSVMSMHPYISMPWAESILSDAFPNDADAVVSVDYRFHSAPMRVVINTHEHIPPIFKPYKDLPGVEYSFGPGYGTHLTIPKGGAVVTSYSVGPYEYGYSGTYPDPNYGGIGWIPHTMYWRYGNGTTWTHQDMFGLYWNTRYNPYASDMILAEIIFSTGRKLPDDVVLLHRLRVKFADYSTTKSFIYSLLDFIDKFGANTAPIVDTMGKISDVTYDSKHAYLNQEYEEASGIMDQALQDLSLLQQRSLKLKDRALLWIYIIEWLAVSGVLLVAFFSIWTLMVRRRLYRDVSLTKLSKI